MLRKASLHTRLCNWSRSELAGAPAAPNFGVVNFRSGPTKSAAGVWSVVLPPMLFPERGEPRSVPLPMAHEPGSGAVRAGCALQGLAICGRCGRRLAVYYDGPAKSTPGCYCTGTGQLVEGRRTRHLRVGGVAIDAAIAQAFLAALAPAALQACLAAVRRWPSGASRSNKPATGPAEPSAVTGRSTRQPAGGPRPGKRMEQHPAAAGRRRGRTLPAETSCSAKVTYGKHDFHNAYAEP